MRECYSNNIEVKTHPLGRLQGVVFTHCSNNNELIKRNDSPGALRYFVGTKYHRLLLGKKIDYLRKKRLFIGN